MLTKNTDSEYRAILTDILHRGSNSDDRTGVGTRSKFGVQGVFDISKNQLPAIGMRKVAPRIAFEELMFMLAGKSDTKELEAKKINIWKGNTSREFLDNRGLTHLEEGDFGRMYGVQLREFNGLENDEQPLGFDQLEYMINEIQTNPSSRRIIATHYNPAEADQGALFPCHIMTQFNVDTDTNSIDCLFWMRSSDVGFGLPYNLIYYAFFAHLVAKLTGYSARNLIYQAGDSHIYQNQIQSGMINYMLDNYVMGKMSKDETTITIDAEINSLDDMLNVKWEDITVNNYNPFPDFKDKPSMAV